MAGISMSIAKDGNSFKVNDASTADSTQCQSTWETIWGTMAEQDESTFALTERFNENIETPDLEETIEVDG